MGRKDQRSGGWRGKTARALSWSEFDRLPVGLKRLFWASPYDYGSMGAVDRWREGADMRQVVPAQIAAIAEDVRRESKRLYGQAQEGWL